MQDSPAYCAKQARKTPTIPYHNGLERCTACGRELKVIPHPAHPGRFTVTLRENA